MRATHLLISLFVISILSITAPVHLFGQNEISTQRKSLQGLQEFYFSLNVEIPFSLLDKKALKVDRMQKKVIQKLERADLPVKTGKTPKGEEHAMLIMHINATDAGRGIVPFAINIDLYQPVQLTLNRNLSHTASTWNTGSVGVVTYDKLSTISQAAIEQSTDFIRDYRAANETLD